MQQYANETCCVYDFKVWMTPVYGQLPTTTARENSGSSRYEAVRIVGCLQLRVFQKRNARLSHPRKRRVWRRPDLDCLRSSDLYAQPLTRKHQRRRIGKIVCLLPAHRQPQRKQRQVLQRFSFLVIGMSPAQRDIQTPLHPIAKVLNATKIAKLLCKLRLIALVQEEGERCKYRKAMAHASYLFSVGDVRPIDQYLAYHPFSERDLNRLARTRCSEYHFSRA